MAGFPGDGEDERHGGAGLAKVGAPRVAPFSLPTVTRPFDMLRPEDVAPDGIPSAVKLDDTTGTFAFDRPICLPEDFEGKQAEPPADYWDFHAAGCYVLIECEYTAPDWDRWWQRARAKVEAASPKRLAQRLWFDSVAAGTGYANPSLMSIAAQDDHDLSNADTAMDPTAAIGTLIQGFYDATDTPGDATLHIPPVLSAHLFGNGVVRVVNGRAFGPMDIPVSFGPYPSQVGLDGADIDDVSLTYVAISGQVYAQEGDIRAADGSTRPQAYLSNERRNEHGMLAERRGIFAFDPGPVFAAQCYVPNTAPSIVEEG